MVLVALICVLISLFGLSSGRLSPLACVILLSIPLALAVPPARYYCSRGTLVITYPAGGEIFINGLRYPTCSSVGTRCYCLPLAYSMRRVYCQANANMNAGILFLSNFFFF